MPQVIEWRRDLHRNPELSNREFRTSKLVAAELKSLGFEVRTGVAHTGVVGVLRGGKPGPTIALRADMDALAGARRNRVPFKSTVTSEYRGEKVGVMHACGHDGHTAILLGAARVLAGLRKELPGTVLFIFQPAEEGAPEGELGGAPLMLKEGVFADPRPEAVFGLHLFAWQNVGTIGYRPGPYLAAADTFKVVVHGKQTHGAIPWAGVDPIVTASQIVLGLQTIVSRQVNIANYPAIVSVGAIKGGIRNNIIPDQVELVGTIRTFDTAVRADIIEKIKRTATQIAAAAGATAEFELGTDPNPVVINDKNLTARVVPALERAAGAGNVSVVPYVTVRRRLRLLRPGGAQFLLWRWGYTGGHRPRDGAKQSLAKVFPGRGVAAEGAARNAGRGGRLSAGPARAVIQRTGLPLRPAPATNCEAPRADSPLASTSYPRLNSWVRAAPWLMPH